MNTKQSNEWHFLTLFLIIKKYSFNFLTTTSTTTLLPLFARYLKVLCVSGRRKRFLRLVLDLSDDSIEPSPVNNSVQRNCFLPMRVLHLMLIIEFYSTRNIP